MKWELEALKRLAQNPTVPGIALQDAIGEIEKLRARDEKAEAKLAAHKAQIRQFSRLARRWMEMLEKHGHLMHSTSQHDGWTNAMNWVDQQLGERETLCARVEQTVVALSLLLDQVDYTVGNCAPNEMVGAVLPKEIIDRARKAVSNE